MIRKEEKGRNEAVEEVRDFYQRTRRYDEEHGRETPVIDLGERSDYGKSEEGQRMYEMARYSTEATDELGRKSRGRLFSINLPWKR